MWSEGDMHRLRRRIYDSNNNLIDLQAKYSYTDAKIDESKGLENTKKVLKDNENLYAEVYN